MAERSLSHCNDTLRKQLCSLQLLLPDCICFSCCSPIVSASAAASRLYLLQLLLPDCVCFSCCSPIVSASAAASQLHLLQQTGEMDHAHFWYCMPSVLVHRIIRGDQPLITFSSFVCQDCVCIVHHIVPSVAVSSKSSESGGVEFINLCVLSFTMPSSHSGFI